MTLESPLKIGVVSYSNAMPLVEYLHETLPDATIIRQVPSVLGKQLANKEVDVALLSSIELLRHPTYGIIPGVGVCSNGPVESVCLFTQKDISDITSIALDNSSLTSVLLLKILCSEYWNISPNYQWYSPPIQNGLSIADAALAIGDNSFAYDQPNVQRIDLGEVWKTFTGLPFVYALWLTQPGLNTDTVQECFIEAKKIGLRRVSDLAEICEEKGPMDTGFYIRYFTINIQYDIGEHEMRGMELFFQKAKRFLETN